MPLKGLTRYAAANHAEHEKTGGDAPTGDPADPDTQAGGTLEVSLLYGDGSTQDANPDGVGYYTHSTTAGFIRLEPRDLDADPTGLTVTLSMPKQYVEKDSIRIPPFSTNSTVTEYTIGSVEGNGANYTISIYFTVYDRTQTLMLPFTLSFLDDVVPDNYRLPVTASVSGGDAAAPTIYRPLYKDWEIQKFVNSNRLDAFGKDGAEVVVTPQEEGGNPYLDDLTYVDFAFIVNKYTNDQCGLADLRDVCSVTLTDTLPTYTDRNGVSRIAVFDADQNPGWTLSEDGKTVSRTYTGEHSAEILLQIYNDALHLRFPGLQFTALADGTLEADLDNTVHLEAIPSGEAPGETHPEADDPLRFRLTTDPTTQGKFTKGAEKGDIYDVEVYKTNPYPWSLALSNGKSQPLRHIVIQDRTIVEDGEVVLAGLDEALRFVRLESVTTGASLPEGKTYADLVDHITAYYTDGTTETISALQADAHGNIAVTFDEEKVCDGYDIVFAEDYEMQAGGQVRFQAYTVWARVCFAGFCVKKVNGATQAALPGAEFTLTDAAGTIVGTAVSDADGRLQFRELTEGAYTLAETKVPDGFLDTHVSVAVTITQNPVTLAYSVTFSGDHTGLGTSADPLCIENHGAYVLPKTGGRGTAAFYVPGAFLLLSAAALPDLRERRSRKR